MRKFGLMKLCGATAMFLAFAICAAAQQGQQNDAKAASPTVDHVIDRYIQASGGSAVIQKQTSRVSMGKIDVPVMHLSGTVMIHEKAPDKVLQVVIFSGNAFRQAFDGTTGWSDDPADGLRVLSGSELAETKRDADFYHSLHLREIYPKLVLTGTEKIDDHDAYVVEGTAADASDPDKMYFDVRSGLLLRVISHRHSADGYAQTQEDFSDYRSVDGLLLPFTIEQTGGSADFTIHISEMHHGVDLEDSEFAKPAANP